MAWAVKRSKGWKGCYRDSTSKERSHTFTTKRDAMAWAEEQEAAIRKGEWIDPAGAELRFDSWAERWLAERTDIKPKTRQSYESLLRTQITPRFGSVKLGRIPQLSVRTWVSDMAGALSPSRTRQAYHLFGAVLQSAVDSGLLLRSPCKGIALPRLPLASTTALTATEVARLAEAIEDRYRALVIVLAYGGLRLGEALALDRRSYDPLHGRLHVRRSLAEVGGHLVLGSTKTHQQRTVALGKAARKVLDAHLEGFTEDGPEALIFTAERGGSVRQANFRGRAWRSGLRAAGLPTTTRIHDLRHTCASLLIQAGAHPKAIQVHLGHSSIEVTMDRYGHLFPDAEAALAASLDLVFKDGQTGLAASVLPRALTTSS